MLFTETTMLSFGGAYAVVPWALDESVSRGWIAPAERFDALAMGEATPGPLILVVTFLGFLAGYRDDLQPSAASGLTGAGIATWFAFLPSFAMILALAPFVGKVRASSRLGNALATVGSVIVGAIVLLGLHLAEAAFLPSSQLDPVALLVAIMAGIALLSGRLSAPIVVGLAAVVGVVRVLLG
jgi:chromate transporter